MSQWCINLLSIFQVRIVFLTWLPCILRMSRPGEEIVLTCSGGGGSSIGSSKEKHQIPSAELKERSSKSLIANVLDIDDDYRCNHRCNSGSLLQNPTYFRSVNRWAPVTDNYLHPLINLWFHFWSSNLDVRSRQTLDDGSYGGQITDVNNCLGSSAEFELTLILKELRWITDQVSWHIVANRYWFFCVPCWLFLYATLSYLFDVCDRCFTCFDWVIDFVDVVSLKLTYFSTSRVPLKTKNKLKRNLKMIKNAIATPTKLHIQKTRQNENERFWAQLRCEADKAKRGIQYCIWERAIRIFNIYICTYIYKVLISILIIIARKRLSEVCSFRLTS